MSENNSNLGKLIGIIGPNNFVIFAVVILQLFVGISTLVASGGDNMILIVIGFSVVAMAGLIIWKSREFVVEIYEEGIFVKGIFAQSGAFRYEMMQEIDWQKTEFTVAHIITLYSTYQADVYGKSGALITSISGMFYGDLKTKMAEVEKRIGQ